MWGFLVALCARIVEWLLTLGFTAAKDAIAEAEKEKELEKLRQERKEQALREVVDAEQKVSESLASGDKEALEKAKAAARKAHEKFLNS